MPPDASELERAPRLARVADWLVQHRGVLFVAAILLVIAAGYPASRLKLDESVESFYAPDDPYLLDYLDSKQTFGGDEFVFIAYHDPQLLEPEGLERVRVFAEQLSALPGIRSESTQDLSTNFDRFQDVADSIVGSGFFARKISSLFKAGIIELSRRVLIGDDNETTGIVLRLLPEAKAPISRRETFAQIRELADAHVPRAYVTGEPVMIHDMFRYVEQDGAILGIATSSLLILIILMLFRSLRWMVLPLLLVHAALLWTKAILVLSGMKLSMVSSILTSLITIIGIATVMHVTVRFRELRDEMDRFAAFRQAFVDLAPATFWSCVTTAVGFGALLSSGITPVRSFGMMVALGTMLILAAGALLLPGGVLIGRLDADPRKPPAEKRLLGVLSKVSHGVEHHSGLLLTLFALLTLLATAGMSRLRVETDFSKNFRQASPIVESIHFFEDRLGGVGNWEINFSTHTEDVASQPGLDNEGLTLDLLSRVASTASQLRDIEMPDGTGPTKAVAMSDGTGFIPGLAAHSLKEKRDVLKRMQPEFEESLYNAEQGRMRIMLRAREQQPAETKLQLIEQAEAVAQNIFPDAKATGLYVLLAHLIQSLLSDQVVAFGLAAAGILVTMTIAFRSIRVGLVMLVPNTFPILIVIGGMGWVGVPVNIGTAMIASVSMGLTVDSSIHYLVGYRRSRAAGLDHYAAIHQTHAGVGRALVFASIALVLGFTVLSLSHFIPLIYFGVLVSVAMLGGLLGDLVLLPLLLYWVPVPFQSQTTN
ncbi:MAG: MMPL family transporter [Planctomycetaceae bacterium]|nr:MMPL family transporter [Planctomycetaceae bacterium]